MKRSKFFINLVQEAPTLNEKAEGLLKGGSAMMVKCDYDGGTFFEVNFISCHNEKKCKKTNDAILNCSAICYSNKVTTTPTSSSTSTPTSTRWQNIICY